MGRYKEKSDMRQFYSMLDIDFGNFPPTSKQVLKRDMQGLKYRIKTDKQTGVKYKAEPTDKQVDIAWSYLTNKYFKSMQTEITWFTVERHKTFNTYRATEDRVIGKKHYRKGQFIPKQE